MTIQGSRSVLLYTGIRGGDAVTIGWQNVKSEIATIRTEKRKGAPIEVHSTIVSELLETLSAGPTGDMIWICGSRGKYSRKSLLATCSKLHAKRRDYPTNLLMDFGSSLQPAPRRLTSPYPSWKRRLAGPVAQWLAKTPFGARYREKSRTANCPTEAKICPTSKEKSNNSNT